MCTKHIFVYQTFISLLNFGEIRLGTMSDGDREGKRKEKRKECGGGGGGGGGKKDGLRER